MKDAHDPRCERSRTSASRCRCDCGGVRHGWERVRRDMLDALARDAITEDEYDDWLSRVRATGALR